jgi:hypothetical protein
MHRCCHWGRHGCRKRKTLLCLCPSGGMLKLLSIGWPSLRANLWRLTEPRMWPKRKSMIYQAHRLRVLMTGDL